MKDEEKEERLTRKNLSLRGNWKKVNGQVKENSQANVSH
jgi:hypothetical protein